MLVSCPDRYFESCEVLQCSKYSDESTPFPTFVFCCCKHGPRRFLVPLVWVVPSGPRQHLSGPQGLGAHACLVLVRLAGARSCPGVRPEVLR